MIYSDLRWAGQTGIGRYVQAVSTGVPVVDLELSGNKTGVLAPIQLWLALRRIARTDPDPKFLSMGFMLPMWRVGHRATFIYGLMQRDERTGGSRAKRLYLDQVVRRQVRQCDAVFTISEFSKREIETWLAEPSVPVHNVGAGIEPHFRYDGPLPSDLDPGYLLYVGSLRATKRFDVVIASYAAMPEADRPPLVVVCADADGVRQHAAAAGVGDVVVMSGVSDDELAQLYRGASASILLSESEGFGLPVAESLACGTRVVCSDIDVFSEISDVGLTRVPVGEPAGAQLVEAVAAFVEHGRLSAEIANDTAQRHHWDRTISAVSAEIGRLGWLDQEALRRSQASDASK